MTTIEAVRLRRILDSRGNATVEADIWTTTGFGRAAAPSGASTGTFEAKVRPVAEAIRDAEQTLVPQLLGLDASDQPGFDRAIRDCDGTPDLSKVGANVAVALSLANAKAAAAAYDQELFRYLGGCFAGETPFPLGNVIGGGAHALNATDIQEFLVVPTGAPSALDGVFANAFVHKKVKELLVGMGRGAGKGDEGAWAPAIDDLSAFELVHQAVTAVSDEVGFSIGMGVDVAASELWRGDSAKYRYKDTERSTEDQIAYIAELVDRYNLVYVEDPLFEDDFEGFADLSEQVADRCLICGDDLFVTNPERITRGIELGSANCVLIKPNQIGTLTETWEAVELAHTHGLDTVMSHRSGETTDTTIAHLGTAFGCIFIKTGAVGGERIAKLNELIRIEEQL
jgi:enolase